MLRKKMYAIPRPFLFVILALPFLSSLHPLSCLRRDDRKERARDDKSRECRSARLTGKGVQG